NGGGRDLALVQDREALSSGEPAQAGDIAGIEPFEQRHAAGAKRTPRRRDQPRPSRARMPIGQSNDHEPTERGLRHALEVWAQRSELGADPARAASVDECRARLHAERCPAVQTVEDLAITAAE